MAQNLNICDVSEVADKLSKFRFRSEKNVAAKILKIDRDNLKVNIDEEFEDTSIEEILEELPTGQPRYILISLVKKFDDGRVTYPLVFVFLSPQDCKPELHMLYAGTKNSLVKAIGATKVKEFRSAEDITEEALLG